MKSLTDKKSLALISILLATTISLPVKAAEDAVLDAMIDESQRSMKELRLKDYPAPYYIAYTIKEMDNLELVSTLGSEPAPRRSKTRLFIPEIRVGNKDLDNSNYGPGKDRYFNGSAYVSTDNDYTAIRRIIWLKSDDVYKKAVEMLEAKKAYLEENKIIDRLPDLAPAPPVVSISPVTQVVCDEQKWAGVVQQLSAIFKHYPQLQKSKVWFQARQSDRWFVNSEGTRIRESRPRYALEIWANAQAADGTPISDQEVVMGPAEADLPPIDDLKKRTEQLAKRITDLCAAPEGQDYCGPVLFEDQAAATFISDLLKPNLSSAEEVVHPDTENKIPGNPLKDMLGRRVLPKYTTLVDVPTATEFQGQVLSGGYKFDDQGVPAQKVTLVENGLLKAFCQNRTPTRISPVSNGHALCDRSSASILELTSTQTTPAAQLRQKLKDLAREEGLKTALILRRVQAAYSIEDKIPPDDPSAHDYPTHSLQPSPPVLAYRINVDTDAEELVRGLVFRFASLRSFRDIQATGDDARAYLVQPSGSDIRSLVTPSLLIGEMELQKPPPEHENPPNLKSPLLEDGVPSGD